jgi:hypothetical protein
VEASVGVLKEQGSGREHPLGRKCVIGREDGCHVQVDRDQTHISNEHAEVVWQSEHWALHDKGSKNHTYLEGRQLLPGEYLRLRQGASFTLGPLGLALGFTLVDEAPPPARARNTRTHTVRTAHEGILVLPDDDHLEVSVFEDAAGRWVAESEDTSRTVVDGEEIVAGGDRWKLELSSTSRTDTVRCDDTIDTIEKVALRIVVSRNEENHDLIVFHGGHEARLKSRAHFFLILTLARVRLADADASAGERGWIDRDELCRMMGTTRENLAVNVHRVRDVFTGLKIHGAANVIERRTGTGQIRLGIDTVEVVKL